MGHKISQNGIQPDPGKIKSIENLPYPQNVNEIKNCLGLFSYFRKFIPNFSGIASPLNALTKKCTPFIFGQQQIEAFEQLRAKLIKEPILGLPDLSPDSEPFQVYTDASDFACGPFLTQIQNGSEKVLQYISRSFNDAEKKHSVTQKECLTVMFAVRSLRQYLLGKPFVIVSDHKPIQYLLQKTDHTGKWARFQLELLGYDFSVKYIKAEKNCVAGALSRLPVNPYPENLPTEFAYAAGINGNNHDMQARYQTPNSSHVITRSGKSTDFPVQIYESDNEGKLSGKSVGPKGEIITSFEPSNFIGNQISRDNEDIFHGEIREHQQKDPFCMVISNYLKFAKDMPPDVARIVIKEIDNFVIDEDLDFLCHVTIPSKRYKISDVRILPVAPQFLIKSILEIHQDSSIGGYFGFLKTYIRIRKIFYFRNMYAIIKKYVQSCLVCYQRNGLNYTPKGPLGSLFEVSRPLELVGIDLLGPLPESVNARNKWILVISDAFSNHVTLVALPNKTVICVAKAFVEKFMLIYGPCENLVSDQGKEFCSDILNSITEILKIKKVRTTSFQPQCNGMTQRRNREIKNLLSIYVRQKDYSDWDSPFPYIQWCINTAYHESLKDNPHYNVSPRAKVSF